MVILKKKLLKGKIVKDFLELLEAIFYTQIYMQ